MTPKTRPLDEPTEIDPYRPPEPVNIEATERSSVSSNVDQSTGKRVNDALPWVVIAIVAIVACSMSGIAVGLSISSRDTANRAEREARLQRLEIDEMKIALQMQGINVHEGSP